MKVFNRIRPNIILIVLSLGMVSLYALRIGQSEIASGIVGGLIVLAKDIIQADAGD